MYMSFFLIILILNEVSSQGLKPSIWNFFIQEENCPDQCDNGLLGMDSVNGTGVGTLVMFPEMDVSSLSRAVSSSVVSPSLNRDVLSSSLTP